MANRFTLACAALAAVATLLTCPLATAQDGADFTSPTGLYSLTIAPGWSIDPSDTGTPFRVDAAFAPGGDVSQGSVFITLGRAAASLEAERVGFLGDVEVQNERHVTIDGIDCLSFAHSDTLGEIINNFLICDVTAPDVSGPARVGFFMMDTATPSSYAADTAVFWQFANSILWANSVTAG